MKPNQPIGLVKFFRNEEYLDKLIDGYLHCQPPEVFRLSEQEGVSDKNESCRASYRKGRKGDIEYTIEIAGRTLNPEDVLGFTIQNGLSKDAWMHCWFTIRLPEDDVQLSSLKADIERMKQQFGGHYAFILATSIQTFADRLEELTDKRLIGREVVYTDDEAKWDNLTKSLDYSYQREYRFLLGECSTSEKESFVIEDSRGFSQWILKSPSLKFQNEENVFFDLAEI